MLACTHPWMAEVSGETFSFVVKDGCIFKHCAKWYRGNQLMDERFRRARTGMCLARRPVRYKIHSAMLRKYPSATPNRKSLPRWLPPSTTTYSPHTKKEPAHIICRFPWTFIPYSHFSFWRITILPVSILYRWPNISKNFLQSLPRYTLQRIPLPQRLHRVAVWKHGLHGHSQHLPMPWLLYLKWVNSGHRTPHLPYMRKWL